MDAVSDFMIVSIARATNLHLIEPKLQINDNKYITPSLIQALEFLWNQY